MTVPTVAKGKVVSLTYTIHDEMGKLFEHSDLPISYLHGSGVDLFDKIEQAIENHLVGDKLEVVLTPESGFGNHDPSLTFTDDINNVPPEYHKIGAEIEAKNDKGESMKFYVTRIDQDKGEVLFDANHLLAGQTVKFNVTITEIRDATHNELKNGRPDSQYEAPLQ